MERIVEARDGSDLGNYLLWALLRGRLVRERRVRARGEKSEFGGVGAIRNTSHLPGSLFEINSSH